MLRNILSIVAAMALVAFSQGAAAQQPAASKEQPPAAAAADVTTFDTSYSLGHGDVVDIGLVGRSDFSSRVRVGSDGTVLLPLIGRIPASGRTVLELAEDIRQALIKGGYYSDAVVRAEVVGISSRYATVLGFVGTPGLIPLDRNYRLSEILARVGGRVVGGADYVLLTRAAGGPPQRFLFDELASATGESDPTVGAGDKIFVPAAENEVFYISGQVKNPGAYPASAGLTFRKAIARGGGVTENGSEGKLKVVRDGKRVKVKLDDAVQVGDVITIGERLF